MNNSYYYKNLNSSNSLDTVSARIKEIRGHSILKSKLCGNKNERNSSSNSSLKKKNSGNIQNKDVSKFKPPANQPNEKRQTSSSKNLNNVIFFKIYNNNLQRKKRILKAQKIYSKKKQTIFRII